MAPDRPSPAGSEAPLTSLRPHDLLRPRTEAAGDGLTGPRLAPEADDEHRPLTLDDVRRSATSSPPAPGPRPADGTTAPTSAGPAAPPERDRFASVADKGRPPRPSDLAAPAKPVDGRPPLFPAPPSTPLVAPPVVEDPPVSRSAAEDPPEPSAPVPAEAAAPPPPAGGTVDLQHPYLDLPYDDPSPAPGSEPEPEPTSRRRRRRPQDDRPNAATMAMAAGRIPSDAIDAPVGTSALPPPPDATASPPATGDDAPAVAGRPTPPAPAASERPTTPADSSSLGPLVFSPSTAAVSPVTTPPKGKSSPLSVAAILMTIAIAVVVLWPTYQSLVDSESGPALPPPSAGPIGFAPAGADGSRAPVDPNRTASWETSAPADGGFEVDMPGVVVVRTPTITLGADSGSSVVASSSSGRGGYVVAAVDPPDGKPFASSEQAAQSILSGFNGTPGNELVVGPATTLGGLPAVAVEGSIDGVPSKGAVVLAGPRAFLAASGNVTPSDHDRFLASFQPDPA